MAGKEGADRNHARWVSLDKAASHLGLNADALRKTFERRAERASDGVVEAAFDGVRARKFGRLWRVRFSEAWGAPVSSRVIGQRAGEAREGSRS